MASTAIEHVQAAHRDLPRTSSFFPFAFAQRLHGPPGNLIATWPGPPRLHIVVVASLPQKDRQRRYPGERARTDKHDNAHGQLVRVSVDVRDEDLTPGPVASVPT